jgi:hypothetical protein
MQPNALLLRQNFIIRKKWVLHPVTVPVVLWSLPLFCSAESHHSLRDTIYVIIIKLYS